MEQAGITTDDLIRVLSKIKNPSKCRGFLEGVIMNNRKICCRVDF
jgi:hypothetical protein